MNKLTLLLLALNACLGLVTSLPISTHRHSTVGLYDTRFQASYPPSLSKHDVHFLEWLADSHPEQRDSILQAEERRQLSHRGSRSSGNNWMNGFHKSVKAWSLFYGTPFPARMIPSQENETDTHCTSTTIENTTPCHRPHRTSNTRLSLTTIWHTLTTIDIADACSDYGTELVALCIFLLVPLAVVLVEVVDIIHDRWMPEQFPERGRGRIRLTGQARRMSVMEKLQREKVVQDQAQKAWAGSRRGSRNS